MNFNGSAPKTLKEVLSQRSNGALNPTGVVTFIGFSRNATSLRKLDSNGLAPSLQDSVERSGIMRVAFPFSSQGCTLGCDMAVPLGR